MLRVFLGVNFRISVGVFIIREQIGKKLSDLFFENNGNQQCNASQNGDSYTESKCSGRVFHYDLMLACFGSTRSENARARQTASKVRGPFAWGKDPAEAVHNGVVLEELEFMAYHTLASNSKVDVMQKELLDKHYLRKHGKNSYYGQKKFIIKSIKLLVLQILTAKSVNQRVLYMKATGIVRRIEACVIIEQTA